EAAVGRSRIGRRAIDSRGALIPSIAIDAAGGFARRRGCSVYGVMSPGVCAADAEGRTAAVGSKPVAITVIFTRPLRLGSTTAPKMMLDAPYAASHTVVT